MRPTARVRSSVSADEIAHFSKLASEWWAPTGEFVYLHRMNAPRVDFVRGLFLRLAEEDERNKGKWMTGRRSIDVGCGGGIFTEAMARLGATTLGIDAAKPNIAAALAHASTDPGLAKSLLDSYPPPSSSPPTPSLSYLAQPAETLPASYSNSFDLVTSLEVLEHVEEPRVFLQTLWSLVRPGGWLALSTINRSPLGWLLTIGLAENPVLPLVERGTHSYDKYVKPRELEGFFEDLLALENPGGEIEAETRGCVYDPLKGRWNLLERNQFGPMGTACNYFYGVRKPPRL